MCISSAVPTALLLSGLCAHGADGAAFDSPCDGHHDAGPAVLADPVLERARHTGARVIDYGPRTRE
ncbi:MAG: hypothetical protein SV422_14985 [Pseudomonadota bacterium]|nr:hypothetical protein [Pseudomonadota bacterium]